MSTPGSSPGPSSGSSAGPARLPVFPLNTVVFPGVTVPLHVFEDRYRALVHHLLGEQDRSRRLFGIVAIREGYEVGSREARSMYRIGCMVQMTQVTPYDDGRFDIVVVGRGRMRVLGTDTSGPFVVAEVEHLVGPSAVTDPDAEAAARTLRAFESYRAMLGGMRGEDVLAGPLPRDPELLSYALAATCLLTLKQRQDLLEAPTTAERLRMLQHGLREEMRAMRALPSLPATEVARVSWSPN